VSIPPAASEVHVTRLEVVLASRMYERHEQWMTMTFRAIKADAAIVVVSTDAGVAGVGEACAYGNPTLIAEHLAWLARVVVGRSVAEAFRFARPTGTSWATDCAVGGLDCALWDVCGKLADATVAELLGAAPDVRSVPVYASGGCRYDWRSRPEDLIDEVRGYADAGHVAAKIRLGTEWAWDAVTPDRFLGLVGELVAEVGSRIRLMVDGNQRLGYDDALAVARGLEALGVEWFEEPLPQDDIDAYCRLRGQVGIPITGGERLTTVAQFRPYLERGALSVVQPDAGWCGITEARSIAELANAHGVGFAPHSWHNGLMALANAQLVAALPNALALEISQVQGPLFDAVVDRPLEIAAGRLALPSGAGLGAGVAADLTARFPFIEGTFAVPIER
jgi:L-alanine-DL-glutamate epimerase-like enolase superfamily enzyme